jgi:hypothetical protein
MATAMLGVLGRLKAVAVGDTALTLSRPWYSTITPIQRKPSDATSESLSMTSRIEAAFGSRWVVPVR